MTTYANDQCFTSLYISDTAIIMPVICTYPMSLKLRRGLQARPHSSVVYYNMQQVDC